ncbi:MAG TPA: T9SS type A sorting domain-containing protein [Aequorivita sp.]|nr:T9SS type A sorting domain-containing protein [Aequorivita sp.]
MKPKGMNHYFTFLFILIGSFLHAQVVNIPDINFKNALIEAGVDTNGDGEIQVSEAEAVINLNISFKDIQSMEGIQSFINLQVLHCSNNQLSSLNMSHNLNLQWLRCGSNYLSNLDITQNLNLIHLWCDNNQLSDLDVSHNLNLESLWCRNNPLSSIDLSLNLNLESFDCSNTQLNILDLSKNSNLRELYCEDSQLTMLNIANGNNYNMHTMVSWANPDLLCVQVDDENASRPECDGFPVEGWCKDEWTSYSEDCKLGVDDKENLGFKLYPNPVKDIMILESDVKIINPAIKIFSLEGRLLSTQNLEFEKQTSLDVSRLSNGIYLLQITSEGKQITYKFMKE